MEKEIICISCPVGCRLNIKYNEDLSQIDITGNACPRGLTYGRDEMISPKRMVTSTVRIKNAELDMLPVKTIQPIPKQSIEAALGELKQVDVSAPVKIGDIILKNAAGTGIDIVATRSLDRKK